jgi:signal transduction histidine kinase
VPQAARARLFAPFVSVEVAPGRTVQGTGLGLFVCRRLAEQLGGTIGYEPGAERGSVFWFDQPRTTAPAAAATR